jgi:hypothetical protein
MSYDPDDFCKHCSTHLDNPNHSSNCPAYDGPPPDPEGLAPMREQLNAIADALIYLCERADPMATADDERLERFPILTRLRETKS